MNRRLSLIAILAVFSLVLFPCSEPMADGLTVNSDGSVSIGTPADVGNIRISGNTISSTDTNGDIILSPDGTGSVVAGSVSIGGKYPVLGSASGVLRRLLLKITNGTNASTLKLTVTADYNGDAIAETDNVAKNATTGDFSLNAGGTVLTIEASGLTGNCLGVMGAELVYNGSGTTFSCTEVKMVANDIYIGLYQGLTALDMTTLADGGIIYLHIAYLTSS